MKCSIRSHSKWLARGAAFATLVLWLASGTTALAESAARAQFRSGQEAYNVGQFQEALAAYTKAYQLKPLSEILFNIAQCHRHLGQFERSAFFYKRYLALSPHRPKNAALVEQLLAEVNQKLEEQRRAAEQAAAAAATPPADAPEPKAPPSALLARESATAPGVAAAVEGAAASAPAQLEESRSALTRRWWFWAGVAVVAGSAAGTTWLLTRSQMPPSGSLSTIDARH